MTTTTETLASWLLARIADDEAVARHIAETVAVGDGWFATIDRCHAELAAGDCPSYIADYDPARALAECAAKQRIVELHTPQSEVVTHRYTHGPRQGVVEDVVEWGCDTCDYDHTRSELWTTNREGCDTLRALAAPYADAPGFREEWR